MPVIVLSVIPNVKNEASYYCGWRVVVRETLEVEHSFVKSISWKISLPTLLTATTQNSIEHSVPRP
jgi:hypothetical protein